MGLRQPLGTFESYLYYQSGTPGPVSLGDVSWNTGKHGRMYSKFE